METQTLFDKPAELAALEQIPKSRPLPTLIEAEEWLQALIETEGAVDPAANVEYRAAIHAAIATAVDKRQRVAETILHFDAQAEFAKKYAQQIADRGRKFQTIADGIRAWVLRFIEQLPREEKGRRKGMLPRLEGHTLSMSARSITDQVIIVEPDRIPFPFQECAVVMPAEQWVRIVTKIGKDDPVFEGLAPKFSPDTSKIKAALQEWEPKKDIACTAACVGGTVASGAPCPKCNGRSLLRTETPVPGAELVSGRNTLVVK